MIPLTEYNYLNCNALSKMKAKKMAIFSMMKTKWIMIMKEVCQEIDFTLKTSNLNRNLLELL